MAKSNSYKGGRKADSGKQWQRFLPFLLWWDLVTPKTLQDDFFAGLTGAVIVLPQGVAYAMIAGLPPEFGLYTAIITPVVAALFGSSLHLISGPTAAVSIVVMSVVSSMVPPGTAEFVAYALILTLMTGLIQLVLGLVRMGSLVNFISHTVVIGFTAGAAILIAASQFKYVLGVSLPGSDGLLDTFYQLSLQLDQLNLWSVLIAFSVLISTLIFKYVAPKLPAMLFGLLFSGLLCWLIDGADKGVALVGELNNGLPELVIPSLSFELIRDLAPGAFALAILALIEAVSIARAVALRSHQRIDGNQEFIGQGLSNIVGSLFSCYAGSGSFTRTGANYDSGAKTPMAAIFAAFILLLIILLLPQVTAYLPLPAMAGSILLIAWRLIDFHHIRQILRISRQESAVLLVTFFSTLFLHLEFAVYVGVILSLLLYLKRVSQPQVITVAPNPQAERRNLLNVERLSLPECPQLKILRLDGSLFFGAVSHVQSELHRLSADPAAPDKVLLLCKGVNFIDLAGAEMLLQEVKRLQNLGGGLYICSLKVRVKAQLDEYYIGAIGPQRFYSSPQTAIRELSQGMNQKGCISCSNCIFTEQRNLLPDEDAYKDLIHWA
ncbi:MAG: SulP family inorganic anion transporter [Amphritea sp.]